MSNKREEIKQLDQSYWAYVKRQFKKNKRAVFSLYFVGFMVIIALSADFLANEKPIYCQYKGNTYFPIFRSYGVALGLSTWPTEFQNVKWSELQYDKVVHALIPYSPENIDYSNSQFKSPFADQRVKSKKWWHWLGTDELGRDVLSGMIHATRIALSVGLISMFISTLIGVLLGSLAGFFGDERMKMSRIRLWLNVLFFFVAVFFAFSTRGYAISDALAVSPIKMFLQLLLSFGIFGAIMLAANGLASILSKIPFLGKEVNVPIDLTVSRLVEIMVSIPHLFLLIAIVATMERGSLVMVMVIIGFTSWTGIARLIRGELLKVRNLEYIEAAQALGYSSWRSLFKHAIPNALSPVLISIAFGIASAVLVEAFLSFLGIGVPPKTVTWGSLLNLARSKPEAWWLAIFPGFAIFITVTLFNLIGEGLTDALDPRLKQ